MSRRLFSYPVSLAVVVAALILITGGWIAWWNYRAGVQNVRSLAGGLFDQIARQTAGETESFLRRAPPAAETLGGLAALDPDKLDRDALTARLLAVLRANPSFKWVSYSANDGEFLGVYRTPSGSLRTNHSSIVDGKTVLDEHDVLDDGTRKLARHEDDTKYDPRTRPYYGLAKASASGVWTPPYVFAENVPGITYALRVMRGGELAGVLTIDFDLGRLSKLVHDLQFAEHGRVAIVADDGVVLAHPTEPIVRQASGGAELVQADQLNDSALRTARTAAATDTEIDVAGESYLARSVAIGEPSSGSRWHVLAYAPEADFTDVMRRRVLSSLLISGLAVLIAVAIAWRLARRVSGPLIVLAGEMVKVGDLRLEESDRTPQRTLFREIDMMNTALTRMKGGLRSFARYVPRDLVRTLLASGHDAVLSGEVRELTVYFSDLAGFTSLAETKAPDELVKFLSEYFDDMSSIIASEKGTVDKYMGDGIMAFWGAPIGVADHPVRACAAALRCQKCVGELAARGATLTTRIGVATGSVLVGNIGSTERLNYTVMGDVANLASRLEGLNKQYGTNLAISEATYEAAADHIVARPLDVVAVKGKKQGIRVYELLAMRADASPELLAVADASKRALDAYLARRFTDAVAAWDEVLASRPADRAAAIMRNRAADYAKTPPPPEWTGVNVATEK